MTYIYHVIHNDEYRMVLVAIHGIVLSVIFNSGVQKMHCNTELILKQLFSNFFVPIPAINA